MSPKKRIVFFSQHFLGVGHHFRNFQIVRALAKSYKVYFVDGGREVHRIDIPSVTTISLPTLFKDLESQRIVCEDPKFSLRKAQEKRKQILLEKIAQIQPDIFVIELFPFARSILYKELIPAIQKARAINPKAKVICSLREIIRKTPEKELSTKKPPHPETLFFIPRMIWYAVSFWRKDEKNKRLARLYYERVVPVLNRYFDYVLVHGDPRLFQLESFFPWIEKIEIPVEYTGYVSEKLGSPDTDTQKMIDKQGPYVLVSVGGGILGWDMITTAVQTWKILRENGYIQNMKMVIFVGVFMKDAEYDEIKEMCTEDFFFLSRFTNDFLQWMQGAELSISQAGYNTCMNVLETGVKAILVPISAERDLDQAPRAKKLSELGIADMIRSEDLTLERMANAILERLESLPVEHNIVLNGAERTEQLLSSL
ncbi:MAG: glycosyltransferase [Gemmatimonadota bacterium]|nr:glycosyltransferase [Gemmatimonadota bacterium]MDE2953940.1 glycosyltransferase [Gemmatimonadota bacterium]